MENVNIDLLDFIEASPTPFHAVHNVRMRLIEDGYTELYENGTASRQYTVTWIALAVAAAWCLLLSVGGASAFIYFQF